MNNIIVYLAVDKDGVECMYNDTPKKYADHWNTELDSIELPKGTIKKLTGKDLTFEMGYVSYVGDDYDPTID
jgi:hypothetical protein